MGYKAIPRSAFPLVSAFALFAATSTAGDPVEDLFSSIDRGRRFLMEEIKAKQVETGEDDDKLMGKISLETYALIVSGLGVDDPIIAKNLESLSKMPLYRTYCIACYILNRATSSIRQVAKGVPVVTGNIKFSKEEGQDLRYWVSVQECRQEFYIPALLRLLKLRPRKMQKPVELALKSYGSENLGFLVLELHKAMTSIEDASSKKLLDLWLKKITGCRYDDPKKYKDWHRRWIFIDSATPETKESDQRQMLDDYLKTNESLPLKKKIMVAIGRCRIKSAAEILINDLSSENPEIRKMAYQTIEKLKLSDRPIPPFDPAGSEIARKKQAQDIQDWYRNSSSSRSTSP
jgi:hypothetical protein